MNINSANDEIKAKPLANNYKRGGKANESCGGNTGHGMESKDESETKAGGDQA